MKPLLVLLFALATASLPAADAPKAASPAKVGTLVKETDLNTITLTPQAEKRLGIVTVAVERKSVPRTRSFGGDVTVRAGSALTVTAPIAATVVGTLPQPGTQVKRGQALCGPEVLLQIMKRVEEERENQEFARPRCGAGCPRNIEQGVELRILRR